MDGTRQLSCKGRVCDSFVEYVTVKRRQGPVWQAPRRSMCDSDLLADADGPCCGHPEMPTVRDGDILRS